MSKIYHADEWYNTGSETYHCGDCSDLAHMSNSWLHPCRILAMTPADYVKWVVENFNPIVWHNADYSLVFFSWERQSDMRRFKNRINAEARQRKYFI